MPRVIHCRGIKPNEKYRMWSTIVDRYASEPMTYDEALDYLIQQGDEIDSINYPEDAAERRLARAYTNGSSEYGIGKYAIGIDHEDRWFWHPERL